jgi:hypothetical protein
MPRASRVPPEPARGTAEFRLYHLPRGQAEPQGHMKSTYGRQIEDENLMSLVLNGDQSRQRLYQK